MPGTTLNTLDTFSPKQPFEDSIIRPVSPQETQLGSGRAGNMGRAAPGPTLSYPEIPMSNNRGCLIKL